jgi:hypothetical protein
MIITSCKVFLSLRVQSTLDRSVNQCRIVVTSNVESIENSKEWLGSRARRSLQRCMQDARIGAVCKVQL